jgi:hypothetical protein
MSRVGWLLLVLALAGGAVAAVPRPPLKAVARSAADAIPADDPFPIRRVRADVAQLPDLVKQLEPGPLVRLPRAEFESRARAAGRAVAAARHAARVVDATYSAELEGGELTGTAELGVLNAHAVTGFAPLDPLRLAVRGAKWADGGEAVLAVPQGALAPAVWVDRPGRRVLQLGWSLAGASEPGERRFDLRVPPCPASVLELSIPAGEVPAAPADVLLTGPFPDPGKPARRLWRLRFGGRSKVEFAVRAAGDTGGVARAALAARYELSPGLLSASFEYELHPAHGSAGEWSFLADPGLRITDVVTNNRAGWSVDPPASPGGKRRVRVSLRQPGPGGKVLISAVAPLPDRSRPGDALPVVRPVNAVVEDEKLEVRIASALRVEAWGAGDYRLTAAGEVPALLPGGEASRVLSLSGTLLPAGAAEGEFRRMPTVRASAAEPDFATRERLEWTVGPARAPLVARVGVRVRRGPLFQIAVRPPKGYDLDAAACGPEELVSHVSERADGAQVIELARPLAAGQEAELHLEFRGPDVRAGVPLAFPAPDVVGAAERDGWLGVSASPEWALALHPGPGARPGGLWGWLTADSPPGAHALYLFRGAEPDGAAVPAPAKPAVAAEAVVRLDTTAGRWSATTSFALDVTGGEVPALVAFVPGPPGGRTWKLLGANAVAEAAAVPSELLRLPPGGTAWVLRLAHPLAGRAVLETTAAGPPAGEAASLPVPRLLGASRATRAELAPAWQGRAEAAAAGEFVRIRPAGRGAFGPPPVSDAYLVTAVRGPDDVLAAFGGTVRDSRGAPLAVALPAGAEVRAVCVAGRWLSPACCAARDAGGALAVPLPAGPAVRFEVRYRLPAEAAWPTRRVASPLPGVAGAPPVQRWWAFAAGVLPGWPARPRGAGAEPPPLLGGPLAGAEPLAEVIRSDSESVRVGSERTADALAAALAAALLAFGLVAFRWRRLRGAVLLAAATAAALAVSEFGPPWWARLAWPPLVAATVALAAALVALAARVRGRRRGVPALAAASLLFLLLHSLAALAQPPTPATVLILSGGGREEVVAPRALLERLDALAHPRPPGAVVTSAEYDLRADESGAHVVAKFVAFAFREGENSLPLPLSDANLEGAAVDGKPAFPSATRPDVYSVPLPGPGRHEVELRFAAPAAAAGPEREVRFGVPEVPRARLGAALPAGARQQQAAGRLGRQAATGGDRPALEADLGGARAVHLRWREGAGGAASVRVREGCVWDVTDAGAELTAAYLVRVEQGALAGLRFDVPRELEVLRVAVRALDAPAAPLPLRDWSLAAEEGKKDAGRLLSVDFQNPTAGRLLAVLKLAPRRPVTRQPVLRFPRVHPGSLAGESESVYGLRASRVTVENVGLAGVIDFAPEAFKDFGAVPDLKFDPANPVRAFRPTPGGPPELRPTLRVGEPASVRTATTWYAGPHRAAATGTVAWSAKEPPPLLEFSVPGVKVLEVRGADVAAWNRAGVRVQVWLRGGAREGQLEWSGTLGLAPPDRPPPQSPAFDPPLPRVQHAKAASEEVRVCPVEGWAAKADRSRGWQAAPAGPGELRFRSERPAPPQLRVQLTRARP